MPTAAEKRRRASRRYARFSASMTVLAMLATVAVFAASAGLLVAYAAPTWAGVIVGASVFVCSADLVLFSRDDT